MSSLYRKLSASIFIGAACLAFAADGGTNITVSGWVIDSACASPLAPFRSAEGRRVARRA